MLPTPFNRRFNDGMIVFFVLLQSLLVGLLLPAQLLGHLGIYRAALVIPSFFIITGVTAWASLRYGMKFYRTIFPPASLPARRAWLDTVIGVAAVAILILLVVLPVARWPFSPISETLNWDAGAYHLPKALELLNTGSVWDFTFSYGEYPFGYESLFSAAAMLDRGGYLFGAAHLLSALYFITAFWFLLRRFTQLPAGLTLYFVAALATAGTFLIVGRTPWFIYRYLIYTIGKNDLFLGATLLAVILHAPIGPRPLQRIWFPLGMALATFLSISTKPNGMLTAAPLWVIALIYLWKDMFSAPETGADDPGHSRPPRAKAWPFLRRVLGLGLIMLPGFLWLGRNFIVQGYAFSPDVTRLQKWSILHNLTNPYFYNYIPIELIEVLLIGAATLLLAFIVKRIHWTIPVVFVILLLVFAYTAQSGFYGSNQTPTEIGWRFSISLITFAVILPLTWAAPWLNRIYAWLHSKRILQAVLIIVILGVTGRYLFEFKAVTRTHRSNEIVLRDQFREPVGVDGYHSPYDYIYQNVQNSVVWVENGLNYYVYGKDYTNITTRERPAAYVVVLQTPWFGGEPKYPAMVTSPDWDKNYFIIYEDAEGRVYQRRPDAP